MHAQRAPHLPASVRIGLAYTFVYTHALYGAEAWAAPRNELDKMDAICKAALRLTTRMPTVPQGRHERPAVR